MAATPQGAQWSRGIDYTAHLTALMRDIVERVPALNFIDLERVLVFARPGRTGSDGPYASCHCLALPDSAPGYYFWSDRHSGAITRCSEWFVMRSPEVLMNGRTMNYLISFSLPRFTDQRLSRSRKRVFYPEGTPDWVAKLDTVVHELYHIDPEQSSLRRFYKTDGTELYALHSPTYFEDVATLVQTYLRTAPDRQLLAFLAHDFAGLTDAYGAVAGTTFRPFPSYPRRYKARVDAPRPSHLASIPIEPIVDDAPIKAYTSAHLQLRQFRAPAPRFIEQTSYAA